LIALLEDNLAIAQFIVAALEVHGYHVVHFSDSAALLVALQSGTYEMVLTDFMLPGEISGFQLIASLQERYPTLPIIVITAASKSTLTRLSILYPTIPILAKPFRVQDLLKKMASVSKSTFQTS
jgi:DNA-binding response OmpR family regulator